MNGELSNSHHFDHAGARLQNIIRRNRSSDAVGVYAVCSAHPAEIAATAHEANAKDWILPVESTSSQVNQFGGYTGQNPEQFASFVPAVATEAGLPVNRILPSRYSSRQRFAQPFCLLPIVVKQVVFAEFDTRLNHTPITRCAFDRLSAFFVSEENGRRPFCNSQSRAGADIRISRSHFCAVGPWRARFLRRRSVRISNVRDALESAMRRNPGYWRDYYTGDETQLRLSRFYSYHDRCRYYWPDPDVKAQVDLLIGNLTQFPLHYADQSVFASRIRGNAEGDSRLLHRRWFDIKFKRCFTSTQLHAARATSNGDL